MADHEDYLSGEAPMAHAASHESLGSDEISVAGLLGVTAELAAHALIATAHQDAPGLIAAHAAIAAAHHARYTDAEVTIIANAQIATHAAIPTAHQNAPALIATHKADASAHHAKYTDAEARVLHSPVSIPPAGFFPRFDTNDWQILGTAIKNRVTLNVQDYYFPLLLPHGVTVTNLTLYGYRDDAASVLSLYLFRVDRITGITSMAVVIAGWTTGYSSGQDTTINLSTIDNENYSYIVMLHLDPNDSVDDCYYTGAKVYFTG